MNISAWPITNSNTVEVYVDLQNLLKVTSILAYIRKAAEAAGVPCDTVCETSDHPYDAILKTADSKNCDLILMTSHGRKGLAAVLLGSETRKVLTHTRVPVLVVR